MTNADIIMFRENIPGSFVCEDKVFSIILLLRNVPILACGHDEAFYLQFSTGPVAPVNDASLGGQYSIRAWGAKRSAGVFYTRFGKSGSLLLFFLVSRFVCFFCAISFTRDAVSAERFDLPLTSADAPVMIAYTTNSNDAASQHDVKRYFAKCVCVCMWSLFQFSACVLSPSVVNLSAGSALPPSIPLLVSRRSFTLLSFSHRFYTR